MLAVECRGGGLRRPCPYAFRGRYSSTADLTGFISCSVVFGMSSDLSVVFSVVLHNSCTALYFEDGLHALLS